jgi:hypothetical protein
MKKIMAALLVAALVAGSAFGQTLKIGGRVDTGFALQTSADPEPPVDNGPSFTPYAQDANVSAFRINLDVTATNAAGNAGVEFRFRADATNEGSFKVPYAEGWWKPLDILKVTAGFIDDGSFNSLGTNDGDVDEGLGTLLVLSPTSDFSIGAGVYYGKFASGKPINDTASTPVYLKDAKYTFGAKYTVPGIVALAGSFRTGEVQNSTDPDALPYNMNEPSAAVFGASLLAVPNLKAAVELKAERLDKFGDFGTTTVYENFVYTLDALQVGVNGREKLFQADGFETAILVHPFVQYTTGKFVPRLDFGYIINGNTNDANKKFDEGNFALSGAKDTNGMKIVPSVQYNIDGKTYVKASFVYNTDTPAVGDDTSSSFFVVNFRWNF